MALGEKNHPYVHSNFFNFTGKSFDSFFARKNEITLSGAVQKKIQELETVGDKLKRLTDDFLGGKTIQELVNDIKEPYKQYNEISKEILTDIRFYQTIQHQVQIKYSVGELQSLTDTVGVEVSKYITDDSITLTEIANAVADTLIKQIGNKKVKEQKEELSKIFNSADFDAEAVTAALNSVKGRLGGAAGKNSPLLKKITKELIQNKFNSDEKNTREIIIKTFEDFFNAKVKEKTIIAPQTKSYSTYLRTMRRVLEREIDKELKTGGNLSNIFGVGGEGLLAAVSQVGNNSLLFTVIGSETGKDLFDTKFLANNPSLYSLKDTGQQFYADMQLTNFKNGKTALVQSKNYQGLLNFYLSGENDIKQQMKLMEETTYIKLMEKVEKNQIGHFDENELSYIIANEAWFSKYGSINGKEMNLHKNMLNTFFTDIILNYLGVMVDKNLEVIPDLSVLFYCIDNSAFIPTYKVIENLASQLINWGGDEGTGISIYLDKTSIAPKYNSVSQFYEEKRKAVGGSFISPKSSEAYTSPGLLKVGMDQGSAILNSLKIHSINLDISLDKIVGRDALLTSAYRF